MINKKSIQKFILKFGYELKKAYPEAYEDVSTLDLLQLGIHELMRKNGQHIKFVQIGANDGVFGDPLRSYILKYQWEGILVEPQPRVFERLVANYQQSPQLKFENCAIARQDGSASFYSVLETGEGEFMGQSLASFDRKPLDRYVRDRNATVEELTVPTLTPASLLAKHHFDSFNLLQIDAEGYDFELIQMFDLGDTGPTLIHFESGQMNPMTQKQCYQYLTRAGYAMFTLKGDTVAMKNLSFP